MDRFTTLANKILKENFSILEEDNELLSNLKTSTSFGDFLRGLTGKTRKDILDSASYARLYVGNRFGITSAANDESNPEVLLSKFLTKLGDFVNQGVMEHRPRLAETEEFKKKYGYDEYLRQEQERRDLMKAVIKAPSGPEKDKARKIQRAFRNTSEYAEAMRAQNKKEDQAVRDFHNRSIERGELVNDGSDKYTELANLFYDIQQMRSGNVEIEDQENFLKPEQEKAIEFAQKLATDPKKSKMFGPDPQKEINKAYGQKMIEIANKIKSIKI